jgi:Porin subfamily
MDRRIALARSIVVVVTTVVLSIVIASSVDAQTLSDPFPQTTTASPPAATTKSRPAAHVRNCSAYGAGFMVMPGTDMCIKIGGSVTVEASH